MMRQYWFAGLVGVCLFSFGCSAEVGDGEAMGDAEDVGETSQALADVPGLTLDFAPIQSTLIGTQPTWAFGCKATFKDRLHLLETRCILQEYTPQTNSWRSISPWDVETGYSPSSTSDLYTPCTANHVSILRAINRTRVRTQSGAWTDLEEKISPSYSVRCTTPFG